MAENNHVTAENNNVDLLRTALEQTNIEFRLDDNEYSFKLRLVEDKGEYVRVVYKLIKGSLTKDVSEIRMPHSTVNDMVSDVPKAIDRFRYFISSSVSRDLKLERAEAAKATSSTN